MMGKQRVLLLSSMLPEMKQTTSPTPHAVFESLSNSATLVELQGSREGKCVQFENSRGLEQV